MQCENCNGLCGDDECMIQEREELQHLLYDRGKEYGCRLTYRTYKYLYDYIDELKSRSYSLITGVAKDGKIISREPTNKEVKQWKREDKKFKRVMKKLERKSNE